MNEQLSNLNDEEKKGFSVSYTAYRARVARDDDTSVVRSRAYYKMNGGRGTDTDCVMDTGCTFPITTTSVAEAIGAEVKPLIVDLEIIDASGKPMEILGTIRMFVDNRILGGRKLVEAAVIQGDKKKTLISLKI